LYCAWGLDVYDLFVNTKSDLGPNPYTVDEAARKEYLSLPPEEKDRLGFEAKLFSKLQELVQHCDRTVARNQDKLQRELQRQSQKRGTQDYVVDVSDGAVEELVRTEVQFQYMKEDLQEALENLAQVRTKEEEAVKELKEQGNDREKNKGEENEKDPGDGDGAVKEESSGENAEAKESSTQAEDSAKDAVVKQDPDAPSPEEQPIDEKGATKNKEDDATPGEKKDAVPNAALEKLGALTLEKQRLLCLIASLLSQLGPLEDSIEVQLKNLNHVKSDITSDKTVCEISGNFMSSRDADERIAAHYAGKQYVGWKLVRDKFKEMVQKHGKYGPPRPGGGGAGSRGGGGGGGGPLLSHQQYQQQQIQRRDGGGGYRGNDRGGDRRGPPGRWERSGGYDRGGHSDRGRYDNRRNDRGHRSGRGSYGRR